MDITRVGTEFYSGITLHLRCRATPTPPHRDQNTVDPDVDGNRVQPLISEEQNTVGDFHPNTRQTHKSLAQFRSLQVCNGIQINFPAIDHSGCSQKVSSPIPKPAGLELIFIQCRQV